jgi:peptide/nickel transport system ATP-binding protein
VNAYPFELSGGMCQRVMIALALACRPSLLMADEPTTGLDVTTQAAVMDLLTGLARERNMATLFITHDLGLAADYCDRIIVMHAGHAVESASTRALFKHPRHPYTARLITSTPTDTMRLEELAPVPGWLPDLRRTDLPACRFAERCDRAQAKCHSEAPQPSMRKWITLSHAGIRIHDQACFHYRAIDAHRALEQALSRHWPKGRTASCGR